MLTRLYIEALLVDKDLADEVWEMWEAGLILDELADYAWSMSAMPRKRTLTMHNQFLHK